MTVIETDEAPSAVGTYSQGHVSDGRIVTAGQIGLDPDGGELRDDDFATEARQALRNVLNVVEAGRGTAGSIVKTTVYLTDLANYETLNDVYRDLLEEPYPARSVVEVSAIPKDARVEIDAEATT